MRTSLTPETEQTIINLAHSFDGYAYAGQVWLSGDEGRLHEELADRYKKLRTTGRFWLRPEDNFAVNFYLHRTFHHWGHLPETRSPEWYDMLLLYLHLYRLPVANAYRHAALYPAWASRLKGSAEAAAAEIRLLKFGCC